MLNLLAFVLLNYRLLLVHGIIPAPVGWDVTKVSATEMVVSLPELSDSKNNFKVEASAAQGGTSSAVISTPKKLATFTDLRASYDYVVTVKECSNAPDVCSLSSRNFRVTTPPLPPAQVKFLGATQDTIAFSMPPPQRDGNFYSFTASDAAPVSINCRPGVCVIANLKTNNKYTYSVSECVTKQVCSEKLKIDEASTSPDKVSTFNITIDGFVVRTESLLPSCKVSAKVTRVDEVETPKTFECSENMCVLSGLQPNAEYGTLVYESVPAACSFTTKYLLQKTLPVPEISTTSAGWRHVLLPSLIIFLPTVIIRMI